MHVTLQIAAYAANGRLLVSLANGVTKLVDFTPAISAGTQLIKTALKQLAALLDTQQSLPPLAAAQPLDRLSFNTFLQKSLTAIRRLQKSAIPLRGSFKLTATWRCFWVVRPSAEAAEKGERCLAQPPQTWSMQNADVVENWV
ncbi:MAG: hypothetical protein ACKERG_00090 [Candidatus Hodgkinia cicadicola]